MVVTTRSAASDAAKLTEADVDDVASGAAKLAENAAGSVAECPGSSESRKFSPLSHLTAQSARFGLWEVLIYNPTAQQREYLWEGQKRTSNCFQCILVSTADPTQYILADSHGKGITPTKLKELESKFKPGLVFEMSQVVLAENTKRQYNSTPKTEVVCMARSKFTSVLVSAGKPDMPEPAIQVAASMGIHREQHFDALALIHEITEMAPGGKTAAGQRRVRFSINLIDGSKIKDSEKACRLPVTVFCDERTDGKPPQLFEDLQKAFTSKWAVAVFGIRGVQGQQLGSESSQPGSESSTWSFQSGFSFHWQRASETTKGTMLESKVSELLEAETETVPRTVLQSRSDDNNYAEMEATETTCGLLKTILAKTTVKVIETDVSFWQINWCYVYAPDKETQIANNDGSRLWFQVKVEDETGNLTLFMREKAALSLAGVESKEDFEAARAYDTLSFPQKVSVKIVRKSFGAQKIQAGDANAQQPEVRCYIVEAAEQVMDDIPSKRSLDLITLLTMIDPQTNACVPAGVSMIAKDPHYGLLVSYVVDGTVVHKHCTKAIALVVARTPTVSENMNAGYQMVTDGVKDPLNDRFVCTLMSFCDVKASPDYQLKPARGQKTQMAFVTIIDVLEYGSAEKPPVFLVEYVEKVADEDAQSAPEHMLRRIYFASRASKMQGTSSTRDWTETMSPAIAGKCRRLGRSPTDAELDRYEVPK